MYFFRMKLMKIIDLMGNLIMVRNISTALMIEKGFILCPMIGYAYWEVACEQYFCLKL